MATSNPPLLQFPVDYPIKVVGRRDELTRERLDQIFRRHAPDLVADRISERESREGNFVSITYTIVARSREQVEALVGDVSSTAGVMMVL